MGFNSGFKGLNEIFNTSNVVYCRVYVLISTWLYSTCMLTPKHIIGSDVCVAVAKNKKRATFVEGSDVFVCK